MAIITHRSRLFVYGTLALCVLISVSAYFIQRPKKLQPPSINGIFLSTPTPVDPFTLQATTGQDFTLNNLQQHWTFIFMGFASCPDICPTTLSVFSRVFARLQEMPNHVMPEFVLVSVDPERDTLPKLANYMHEFDPNFIGASGNDDEIKKLATMLNVFYEKIYNSDKTMYVFNHSTSVALINPQGELQAVFTTPLQAEDIANNYTAIVNYIEENAATQ